LRVLVRLHSFRDARPARELLSAAGIEASLLADVPALLTDVPLRDPSEVAVALRRGGIAAESVLPLWEDGAAPPPSTSNTLTFDSAIAQPA
jgi:hypothetical protein